MSYQAAVITVSDRASAGVYEDKSGPAVAAMLKEAGYEVVYTSIVPDEQEKISEELISCVDEKHCDLVITSGGTGLSPRDVTPEATCAVLEREIPAIPQAMIYYSLQITPRAMLSRAVSGIANVYYTLLMLDEQLAISERTQQSWKETVDATRALMDAGLANEAAVSQMEATYYSISTSILDLKEQINQTENSLSLLLAESPRSVGRGKLEGQALPDHLAVGIPMQMLSNRPDVRRAEHSLESAFYATNQARSAFYPSVVLSGSAGWTNSAGSMIVNPGKFLATAIGSLTQPLFNRGANIAQLKIAKAQQEEAELSFRQALLNAGSEVNDALVKYQTARDKAGLFEKQIASLEKAYESTSLTMQYGNTTYLEVLTAQQSLLNAQLTQVANRFTEIQGVINLYQALGGGRE